MALHLPIGPLKTLSGLEPEFRDMNPVQTTIFADDIANAPLGPVDGEIC